MKSEVKPSEEEVRAFGSVRVGTTVRVSQKLIGILIGGAFVFALIGAGTGVSNALSIESSRRAEVQREFNANQRKQLQDTINAQTIKLLEEQQDTIDALKKKTGLK